MAAKQRDYERDARNILSSDFKPGAIVELGIPNDQWTHLYYFKFQKTGARWKLLEKDTLSLESNGEEKKNQATLKKYSALGSGTENR